MKQLKMGAQNNRNLFSHTAGGHQSEIKVSQGRTSSQVFKEDPSCPFQLLRVPHVPWFVAASPPLCFPLHVASALCLCLSSFDKDISH